MIMETYEKLPLESRGLYYPWFLANQFLLDPSKNAPTDYVYDTVMRVWLYAGGSPTAPLEEIYATRDTWPEGKRKCFDLCLIFHTDWFPSPQKDIWVDFGFCVCSYANEDIVTELYQTLFTTCTFDEFYTAYSSSTLIPLIYAHGLGKYFQEVRIRHLADVLEHCPEHKSVWDLKQYILAENVDLKPSVASDYGFVNCTSEEEETMLKKVYEDFFSRCDYESFDVDGTDPIKLHNAASGGILFEYLRGLLEIPKECKLLMKEPIYKISCGCGGSTVL
jgi:hypothetical protein